MDEFLRIAFSLPTVVFTVPVIASLVYWLTVIVGALDLDALGGAEGHAHALEGHAGHHVGDGHVHIGDGAHGDGVDGGGHGHGGDAHGPADGVAAKEGFLVALLSALRLRQVPVTVASSFVALASWVAAFLLTRHVAPILPVPVAIAHALVFFVSIVVGLLAASVAVRPLAPLFRPRSGTRHRDLVGKVVRITTGRVDGAFGEGHLDDGGAGLQLQVRCSSIGALGRGDEALILGWDEAAQSFEVEPMRSVERKEG